MWRAHRADAIFHASEEPREVRGTRRHAARVPRRVPIVPIMKARRMVPVEKRARRMSAEKRRRGTARGTR